MAAGKFNMQKASGGVASITIADGVGATNIVLPESGTVATTTDVDTRVNEVVGQLSTDYYQGAYGFNWDYSTDTYIRTGAAGYTSIQAMMKRCVLNANGTVIRELERLMLTGTDLNVEREALRASIV